jgi:HlyD family secretion protein
MIGILTKQPLWRKLALLLVLAITAYFWFAKPKLDSQGATFAARKGPLEINVLQGGSTEALESQSIKCEVRNQGMGIKILKIVEEGYLVTEEDIKTNKVLVEFDSSEIKKLITQQDIQFEATVAGLTDAQQAYDIQLNQNKSDVKAAEQKAKFALLDFEKFIGSRAAPDILGKLRRAEEQEEKQSSGGAKPAASVEKPADPLVAVPTNPQIVLASVNPNAIASKTIVEIPVKTETTSPVAKSLMAQVIDFSGYTNLDLLGDGEAKQKIRKFEDDLQVARKEMAQTQTALEGTQRLNARGFVTKTELDADEFKFENSRLKVQTAETAQALFTKYDFPKSAEEFLSKYQEAMRELERTRKGAVSKLAQADAKLKSAEGRYNLEVKQRKDLGEQLEKCLIRATKPGLVTFNNNYYYGEEAIREGTIVREQQPIIMIPNLSQMGVKVRIHESYIKKIQKGQKVRITADAFPEIKILGEVTKVGVLPDSQNRWMNPDMNVYQTTIRITSVHDWLKPGMSVKAEILVKELTNVVYVPIQAVTLVNGKQICSVEKSGRQERRTVEIGEFNDEFIEVKSGLQAGEKVFLRALDPIEREAEKKPESKPTEKSAKPVGV